MAFGQGQVSTEEVSFKKYIGVASVNVLAVNPTKEKLEEIYGRELSKAPEYTEETEINGEKVAKVRIDFVIKADNEKYKDADGKPVELISKISFFLANRYKYNSENTKVQVKDKYGRFAWVTVEQAKNHEIPQYSNGPANIDKNYKPAYDGEEDLINFVKTFLNIPSCQNYIDGKWVMKDADKLADCEASLDHISDYFKGDTSELSTILSYQPTNKVKVLFGIKNTNDGKQFQTVYNKMVLRNNVRDYGKLDANVKETQSRGSMSTSEFDCTDLHEYVVKATDLSKEEPSNAPIPTPW
jgi:hypothetical protein